MKDDDLSILRRAKVPPHGPDAMARARVAAQAAFDAGENISAASQGSAGPRRLTSRAAELWRAMMQRKLIATPAIAGLAVLPIAGYAAWQLMDDMALPVGGEAGVHETAANGADARQAKQAPRQLEKPVVREENRSAGVAAEPKMVEREITNVAPPPAPLDALTRNRNTYVPLMGAPMATRAAPPADIMPPRAESRDRVQNFDTNPVRSALESPVSTFSIDVDTASYSFVRRMLKEGVMPEPDSVRVEEMINYFPYDWKGPDSAATPFNSTVTIMPTPWNEHTRLMHVAIKGYDVQPAEKPASNLVFLIDTSGSMNSPDKLPLLKSAFRLLVNQMTEKDTISIVTYAGSAGTVLEPTKGTDKSRILAALDRLDAGGSTAGAEGIEQAYRLAETSFVKGGVNRVLLATDGDFNVGASSDDELERLIEKKRESGVFLSVFGFGRGNLNDQMMQKIAQNGNGTAAYIDTLAEAEKTLVQEAGSTLFPIAKDVKIQVEFNPERISEYRLIGYETRALNREDFNNDKVDAGEIGSGHSVTAIYEITPKGSPAAMIDDLRYGKAPAAEPKPASDELAFVKIRYKLPNEDQSKLITQPVTDANAVTDFASASNDLRFSTAVAAFGQKLRGSAQVSALSYERLIEIATAAKGSDPYGYRAEFLSLVRLASALDDRR
jgi:Ca-activated chloride channel family protein